MVKRIYYYSIRSATMSNNDSTAVNNKKLRRSLNFMIKEQKVLLAYMVFTIWLMACNIAIAGTPMSRTPWRVIEQSLGELLDSGWKIVSHSSNRVVIAPYTNGASDEETHSYILQKNGKYIHCLMKNPRPDNAYSGCRQLN
jgi:hypothetical protein